MDTQPTTTPLPLPTEADARRRPFTPSERGPRRPLAGIAWTILALACLLGLWVIVRYTGGVGAVAFEVIFAALLLALGAKIYAAFSGVRRFRSPR